MSALSRKLYLIAAITMACVGLGDVLFTDLFRDRFIEITNEAAVYTAMQASIFNFAGFERDMLAIYNGFSLSTGVLLCVLGLFNLVLLRSLDSPQTIDWARTMRYVMLLNLGVAAFFVGMSIVYLPLHGVFVGLLLCALFLFVLFREERRSAQD